MMDISYNSKLFSLKHSSENKLSIQVCLNGFSFCVYDLKRNYYLSLKHFPIEVNHNQEYFIKKVTEITENEEILSNKFSQVNFIYQSPNSIIIPEELSKDNDLKNYLEFQHKVDEFDEVHNNVIEKLNLSVAFTIPSGLTNLFLNRFKTINYTNQYSVLINLAYNILTAKGYTDICLLHKSETFFDIVIFKNKQLELCNSFKYKTENDLVFYAVSILKNLDIIDHIPVYYSGSFHSVGRDTFMLDKFINVFRKNEPDQVVKSNNIELFKKHPVHYFAPLYFVNY